MATKKAAVKKAAVKKKVAPPLAPKDPVKLKRTRTKKTPAAAADGQAWERGEAVECAADESE